MENAMFERLELQSDDILQAYYMRSQSLLLLEYAGTLEETLGFSDSTDKPQAVLAQMAAAESPTNGEKLQQAEYFLAFTEKNGEVSEELCFTLQLSMKQSNKRTDIENLILLISSRNNLYRIQANLKLKL